MNEFNVDTLLRNNIKKLIPYASARTEFKGKANIFLDANENNFGSATGENYNRYPDPLQQNLKLAISELKNVNASQIFVGNGSDEPIDLLIRAFCEPGVDNIIICPPTYGIYQVAANINDIEVKEAPLTTQFELDINLIMKIIDIQSKIIFICSPNNPTGNLLSAKDIEILLERFKGLVIIDEAYIDFAGTDSWALQLAKYPNLVVLQTFSKAWGMAGLRIGMAFASEEIIQILNKIKPPYNISESTQKLALNALDNKEIVNEWIEAIILQRTCLANELLQFAFIKKIYPSDANFLLIEVADPEPLYGFLAENGIIVRNRSQVIGCKNCLRVSIGTRDENQELINILKQY